MMSLQEFYNSITKGQRITIHDAPVFSQNGESIIGNKDFEIEFIEECPVSTNQNQHREFFMAKDLNSANDREVMVCGSDLLFRKHTIHPMETTSQEQEDKYEIDNYQRSYRYLSQRVHANAKSKGFYDLFSRLNDNTKISTTDYKEIRDIFVIKQLGLITEEIAEAMSAYREGDKMDDKLTHRKGIEVELADASIRIKDLGEFLGLDISGAEAEKMSFNKSRPYMHGKVA